MFLARMVFFRLHESPRYLVHAGRHQEALESLQMISRFNGDDFDISLYDVDDSVRDRSGENTPFLSPPHDEDSHLLSASAVVQAEVPHGETLFDANIDEHTGASPSATTPDSVSSEALRTTVTAYHATAETPTTLLAFSHRDPDAPPHSADSHTSSRHSFLYQATPHLAAQKESPVVPEPDAEADAAASHPPPARPRPRPPRSESRASRISVTSSIFEGKGGWLWWKLPRWIRRPLGAWLDRFAMVLAPEWIRTTAVVWGVWFGMSLGGPSTLDRPIRG